MEQVLLLVGMFVVWLVIMKLIEPSRKRKKGGVRRIVVNPELVDSLVASGKISEQGGHCIKEHTAQAGAELSTYASAHVRKKKAVLGGMCEAAAIAFAVTYVSLPSISEADISIFADKYPEFALDADVFASHIDFSDTATSAFDDSSSLFDDSSTSFLDDSLSISSIDVPDINPSTGLEMIGGIGGVDVGGHTWCESTTANMFDDSMSEILDSSMFDDSMTGMDDSFSSMDDSFSSAFDDSF